MRRPGESEVGGGGGGGRGGGGGGGGGGGEDRNKNPFLEPPREFIPAVKK